MFNIQFVITISVMMNENKNFIFGILKTYNTKIAIEITNPDRPKNNVASLVGFSSV